MRGPIARADLPGLSARICALLDRHRPSLALCDVSSVGVDAVTVEALGRLQMAARRYDCRVRLLDAATELVELVDFMGLGDVIAR